MAEHSQANHGAESGNEDEFYRMLEEYTQHVRQRYRIPIRINLPRVSAKKANKGYYEAK
ncbi:MULTISPECIES: hypothetical protein [Spirosoma]|uniref:Uncharacterized protein n=1 Tax=Spirosoma liriopis TaxID=2937440 RepID=A0ABT0HGN7_9BACT|nr:MULTISPECIES: hypothetical protein [Spirosoma]MCK8491322.1 hypothetical protein [Spirosoma liriopis]UHG90694.1 hypothetical protein LQ777_20920 [Spirosoma oryzicola]